MLVDHKGDRPMKIQVLSFLVLLLVAAPAQAVTTYSYVGGHFGDTGRGGPTLAGVYTTADGISGSFTVADGFQPVVGNGGRTAIFLGEGYDGVLAYSFTDGHQTLTRANSTASIALRLPWSAEPSFPRPFADPSLPWPSDFQADQWEVIIAGVTGGLIRTGRLLDERGDYGSLDANNYGGNFSDTQNSGGPGTWTATVPEPMSLLLVGAGIGGLFGARRFYRS
jgi:hypothetical protein